MEENSPQSEYVRNADIIPKRMRELMKSFLATKRLLIVAVFVFLCIAIYSFSCIVELSTPLKSWLLAFYSDKQLVLWAGVIANLSVVVIALFLNMFVDYIRRPRFQVNYGNEAPWQIRTGVLNKSDTSQVHVRL